MRLLLWIALACTCAVSGEHVLALVTAALLIGVADDSHLVRRRGWSRTSG